MFPYSTEGSLMDQDTYSEELMNDSQQRSLIFKYVINYSIQLILNKYHSNLSMKDLQDINKDYKHYLNGLNSFIFTLVIRTGLNLSDIQRLVIIINKFLKLNEINKLRLSLNFKQVILALLIKLKDYDDYNINDEQQRINWNLISGYNNSQLDLLINHIEYVFDLIEANEINESNDNEYDIMKINNQDLDKLNAVMRNLIYTNFEIVS